MRCIRAHTDTLQPIQHTTRPEMPIFRKCAVRLNVWPIFIRQSVHIVCIVSVFCPHIFPFFITSTYLFICVRDGHFQLNKLHRTVIISIRLMFIFVIFRIVYVYVDVVFCFFHSVSFVNWNFSHIFAVPMAMHFRRQNLAVILTAEISDKNGYI